MHAGDLRAAIEAKVITEASIGAELGEFVPGGPHPENETQITIAKLIGLGVQDLAAAEVALQGLTVGTQPIGARRPPASILDLH